MRLAPRSVLFLPADNGRAAEKARGLSCGALILDLEDAVAPERKPQARERAMAELSAGFGERLAAVRVNGPGSPELADDLEALARAGLSLDAVVVPKVDGPDELAAVARALPDTPLWAMVETCRSVLALAEIAAVPGLKALILGQNDLVFEMGCRAEAGRAPLAPILTSLVVAARANGLWAFDGVFNDLADAEGLAAECRQGRSLGFDGKTLIHPSQVAPANAAFSPTAEDRAWAQAVVAAFADPANAGRGAIRVGSLMAEAMHLKAAQAILADGREV